MFIEIGLCSKIIKLTEIISKMIILKICLNVGNKTEINLGEAMPSGFGECLN